MDSEVEWIWVRQRWRPPKTRTSNSSPGHLGLWLLLGSRIHAWAWIEQRSGRSGAKKWGRWRWRCATTDESDQLCRPNQAGVAQASGKSDTINFKNYRLLRQVFDKIGTTDPPSKQKNFFCHILSLLAKWNMIICYFGAFLENSLSKQNFPSPHMLAVCMQGEGESLSFFSQASCTVHGFA